VNSRPHSRFTSAQEFDRRREDREVAARQRGALVERMRAGTTAQELSAPGKTADPSSSPAGPTSLSFAPTLRIGGIGRDAKEMPVLAQALITASLSSDPRPTCVVLPDTAHMAALVAVLVSIERLPSDFIAQAEDYMDRVLVEGSRVLSIPEG